MISTLSSKICSLSCLNPRPSIAINSVRQFSPKTFPMDDGTYRGDVPRRWGYEAHHHTNGLLPRLKIKERRLPTMPITQKESEWSKRKATMGQNDFVKIFSDQDIEQHELLTHIPDWLRGYRDGKFEYQMLMKKRKEFEDWRYSKPLKWLHLEQRIKFLYRRLNNKYKPPNTQLLQRPRH